MKHNNFTRHVESYSADLDSFSKLVKKDISRHEYYASVQARINTKRII